MLLSVTQHHERKSLAELGIALIPVKFKLHSWYSDWGSAVNRCGCHSLPVWDNASVFLCCVFELKSVFLLAPHTWGFWSLWHPASSFCPPGVCRVWLTGWCAHSLCVSKSIERDLNRDGECKVNLQLSLEMQSNNCCKQKLFHHLVITCMLGSL